MRKMTGILIKSACVVVASVCVVLVGIHGADNLQKQAIAKLERGAQQLVEQTIIGTINNLGINVGVEHVMSPKAAAKIVYDVDRSLKGDRKVVTADMPKPVATVTYRVTSGEPMALAARFCNAAEPCLER
jgi:hypothetical protein